MPWLGDFKRPSIFTILKWMFTRKAPSFPLPSAFDAVVPDFAPTPDSMKCTWIGHATCLLQADGLNVLTDPVFSERCSPVLWAGPRRYTAPASRISELPKIHLVLISHDHYDHLDYDSIIALEKRFKPVYVCGLRLGSWFIKEANVDPGRVFEFDWWQSKSFFDEKCIIQFLPVQHWSKRQIINDDCRSLWGGFSVQIESKNFFFNGDTGYNEELYDEIGKRCGPFDLAAIPIGAYQPRDIMKTQHVDPDEAFFIHQKIMSKQSFGIHHGTFILTDEPVHEPTERIIKLSKENPNVSPFHVLKHGEALCTPQ